MDTKQPNTKAPLVWELLLYQVMNGGSAAICLR